MLQSVEANLLADLIWIPLGAAVVWVIRRIRREIREDLAAHRAEVAQQLADQHPQGAPAPPGQEGVRT